MKKLLLSLVAIFCAVGAMAQGWPANYKGVMLQAFYWDSYSQTNWSVLESQADELAASFDLIWIPNAGKPAASPSMGYDPVYWISNFNSSFGNETTLRSMINTFKAKGLGTIYDVVINHKCGVSNWINFPNETVGSYSLTWNPSVNICSTDECNSNGYTTTGAADEGEDFNGARDLDHTQAQVQNNCITYQKFLLENLGVAGFRLDMVKGYAGYYTGMYNSKTNPTYCVGEYWDGSYAAVTNWINETKKYSGTIQSAAFDFPMKYGVINTAFGGNNFSSSAFSNKGMAGDNVNGMNRYSVTFVDNHDTYRDGSKMGNTNNELAANAFILAAPGTPCVFLPHWTKYKAELKKMISARKKAGISNQSSIIKEGQGGSGYYMVVQGSDYQVMLFAGNVSGVSTSGWTLVSSGTNYAYYINTSFTPDPDVTFEVPDCATYVDGKKFCYFEKPADWTAVKAWAWGTGGNLYAGWPGSDEHLTKVGTNSKTSLDVYRWEVDESTDVTNIIFNDGKTSGAQQTDDFDFENGAYFNIAGKQAVITNGTGGGGGGGGTTTYGPDQLYVLGNVQSWNPADGSAKMTKNGSTFTYTADLPDSGDGYSYFSFTSALSSSASDWDAIASSRYGANAAAGTENVEVTPGTYTLIAGEVAYKVEAANYTLAVTFTASGQTVTITKNGGGSTDPVYGPDQMYILGNIQGWKPNDDSAKMTKSGSTFTFSGTFPDNGDGYSYFSFTSQLGSSASDWSFSAYRWASASGSNQTVTVGTAYDVNQTNPDAAFKVTPGDYTLKLTFTSDASASLVVTAGLTGIDTVDEPASKQIDKSAIYTLDGRKVATGQLVNSSTGQLPKGIYIQNGRKFVVR